MDYPEPWKWDDRDDAEKKDTYRSLHAEHKRATKTVEAFVKLASRLTEY